MRFRARRFAASLAVVLSFPICLARECLAQEVVHVDRGDAGMVVSDSAIASRVGRDALLSGGNAVDAAVATAMALAVTWPEAGNIGGGGFMLIRPEDGVGTVCVDYRETAPLSITQDAFDKNENRYTHKMVGVPGTVRGLATAHQRYGKLPWRDLLIPAVRLARHGFPVSTHLAESINGILADPDVSAQPRYAELRRVYGKPDGSRWVAGDVIRQNDLADSLAAIADDPDVFYQGPLADQLVDEMQRGNGRITHQDLRRYRAEIRGAMEGPYRGFTVIGAPPPSSGGTTLIEALGILENFDLSRHNRFDPITVHLIAEASRRAFADRARYLGDPDFVPAHPRLTTPSYTRQWADTIDRAQATPSDQIAPDIRLQPEHPDTTHFSIIDADGWAVSNTYTLEASWGSRIVVRGAGFLLNNEMGDFNWFAGETNRRGQIGTKPNLIAPGKRMLSSQSPTMIEKDGRLVLITGSPGGRTIISTVLCVALNVIDFEMSAAAAVAAPRQHHQWFPDRLELESLDRPPHSAIAASLRSMGHEVVNRPSQGSAHTIAIDPTTGTVVGVADFRRGGRPAGIAAGLTAVWDFDEPQKQSLDQTQATGQLQRPWHSGIDGVSTDGSDHLRIESGAPGRVANSFVQLGDDDIGNGTISVALKLDGMRLAGVRADEQLRIGLTESAGTPRRVVAEMVVGRNGDDGILLWVESKDGDTVTVPVVLADDSRWTQPSELKLTVDLDADRFQIDSRTANEIEFTPRGEGAIETDAVVGHLRLGVRNDMSTPGEFISVDRIELARTAP